MHVLARVSNVKTNPEELMKNASTSGLVRYLFGADLSGSLKKEDFVKLQADLISDVLEMEFTRYAQDTIIIIIIITRYAEDTNHNISETDFCRHLLYSSSISQKKKEKMIKMVADRFNGKSEGISFENFKTFYNVLFGGADLERAMFFLDNKNNGVRYHLTSTNKYPNNQSDKNIVIRLTVKSSGRWLTGWLGLKLTDMLLRWSSSVCRLLIILIRMTLMMIIIIISCPNVRWCTLCLMKTATRI